MRAYAKTLLRWIWISAFVGIPSVLYAQESVALDASFACGGALENDVWKKWDDSGKLILESQLIEQRLIKNGDTYALYDIQTLFHNILAMAQRCQRMDRQLQLLSIVNKIYAELSPADQQVTGRAWICRGGAICNSANRLINKEVMLTSVQFLGFASSLANGLAQQTGDHEIHDFLEQTVLISIEHLQRWDTEAARASLLRRIAATKEDVKDGSASLIFSDKDLWQMVLFANLAGIVDNNPKLLKKSDLHEKQWISLNDYFRLLLRLYEKRVTVQIENQLQAGTSIQLANLDEGFLRLYADNRYAAYSGKDKPVQCISSKDPEKKFEIKVMIDAAQFEAVPKLGWDISHARRLVHFFDAMDRNRRAMLSVLQLPPKLLPSRDSIRAFVSQFRLKVWNQNKDYPLFANYYDGSNGWYRVAYDNGTGRCMEGYPPFGLTDSFPTGGYASWGKVDVDLATVAKRIYRLTMSDFEKDQQFIKNYYPKFAKTASSNERILAELMFWPSLIVKH